VLGAYNQATRPGHIGDSTNNGYGNSLVVRNSDTGETFRFSHLSRAFLKPGDRSTGGTIAMTGATGNVTGPHLDVEYRDNSGKLSDVAKSSLAGGIFGQSSASQTVSNAPSRPSAVPQGIQTPKMSQMMAPSAGPVTEIIRPSFQRQQQSFI
jgi:murein DD-endopeptidase MepM/ murein hydrolase activator NlpD